MPSPSGRRKYGERIGKLSLLYSLYTHPSLLQVLLGLSRDFYTKTGGAGGGQADYTVAAIGVMRVLFGG